MSSQQDNNSYLSVHPNVLIMGSKITILKNKLNIIELQLPIDIFEKIFYEDINYSDLLNYITTYTNNKDDSKKLIHYLIENSFLIKKNIYNESLSFHKFTTYEYLPEGIIEVDKTLKKDLKPTVKLPLCTNESGVLSLIDLRESVREFSSKPINLSDLSNILWSTYGITSLQKRTVSSAGNSYSCELIVIVNNVEGVKRGIYKYIPYKNGLLFLDSISRIEEYFVTYHIDYSSCSFSIIITSDLSYICSRYLTRGYRYLHIEAGLMLQNATITALEKGISSVIVGGVNDKKDSPLQNYINNNIILGGMVFGYDKS